MNANTYTKFDRTDFETVLDTVGDYARVPAVDLRGTRELVYDVATDHDDFTVRVFSSLHVDDDEARDVGNDAIKTVLWSHRAGRPVDGEPRTNRIQTWAENLVPKIRALKERAADHAADYADEKAALLAHEFDADDGAAGTIYVVDAFVNDYDDLRVALDGDTYDAKDVIKFDWETTHHDFDSDTKHWVVDAAALDALHTKLNDAGFALRDGDAADDEPDALDAVADSGAVEGDVVEVVYEPKNREDKVSDELAVEAEVVRVDDDRVTLARTDDDHTMTVSADGLYTSGSAFPFVGAVRAVTVVDDAPVSEGDRVAYRDTAAGIEIARDGYVTAVATDACEVEWDDHHGDTQTVTVPFDAFATDDRFSIRADAA